GDADQQEHPGAALHPRRALLLRPAQAGQLEDLGAEPGRIEVGRGRGAVPAGVAGLLGGAGVRRAGAARSVPPLSVPGRAVPDMSVTARTLPARAVTGPSVRVLRLGVLRLLLCLRLPRLRVLGLRPLRLRIRPGSVLAVAVVPGGPIAGV